MKAGLATPEQLRKSNAEQRREQRRETRGKRDPKEGTRTPGSRPPARSRAAPGAPASPGPDTERRKDGAHPSGRDEAGRRRKGGARVYRGRPDDRQSDGAQQRPGESSGGQDSSVQALNLRIRELLDRHALNDKSAEVAFNFARENMVRRVYVTDEQRRKLAGGELAVVGFRRRHHLVPAGVADEIQSLRPIVFVHRAGPAGAVPAPETAGPDAEDPYRDFPVPDDLHW